MQNKQSLYIHIPFCIHKCHYCSFFVLPEDNITNKQGDIEQLKDRYLMALKQEINQKSQTFSKLYTLYIGGGTPYQLGESRLLDLLEYIHHKFDLSQLRECTIEINPDPLDRVPQFMLQVEQQCLYLTGLRRSIGTQTLDDDLLLASKRAYTFEQLQTFFHTLAVQKSSTTRYNLDLIAFGKLYDGIPRGSKQVEWFEHILRKKLFDSISIYTLELFPGSDRYHQAHHTSKAVQHVYGNDDMIFDEFLWLRSLIYKYGYHRQELSNFALLGQGSIHNDVYRSMQSYRGIGINASSYLTHHDAQQMRGSVYTGNDGARYTHTTKRKEYLSDTYHTHPYSAQPVSQISYQQERFFLGLRKASGITIDDEIISILEPNRPERVIDLVALGKVLYDTKNQHLSLTDAGFDVYNSVCTELMK